LFGPGKSHEVHPSNDSRKEGWVQEARLVWNLTDVYDEHPQFQNAERSKEMYAALRAKGDEIKRATEATKKEE
jgi:hypothetical protein